MEYADSRPIWQVSGIADRIRKPASELLRDLVADDLDDAPRERDAALDGLPVVVREVLHLEQLQLGEEAGQRVVQGVLQGLLGSAVHACSGAEGGSRPIAFGMVRSAHDARAAVAACVKEYRHDGDIAKLLAALDAVCAATASTAELIAAVEPYRELHEVAGPVYERVVEREPDNAAALVALANAYWLTGRGPDVVGEIAGRALSADPQNRAAWHLWALTESSPRGRMNRWQQVAQRFPEDKLAHAAMADNAASVASAENDPVAMKLAIGTYELLMATASDDREKEALSSALTTLKNWKL